MLQDHPRLLPHSGTRHGGAEADIRMAASPPDHDVTGLLLAWRQGGGEPPTGSSPSSITSFAASRTASFRQSGRDHTLETTGLVHEAYLRLVDQSRAQWADRGHFFAIAARVMRRVLVDYAAAATGAKSGVAASSGWTWRTSPIPLEQRPQILLALDEALEPADRGRRAAGPGRGVPVLRRAYRGGDRRGAGRHVAHGPARLGQGKGLAPPGARRGGRLVTRAARADVDRRARPGSRSRPRASGPRFLERRLRRRRELLGGSRVACSRTQARRELLDLPAAEFVPPAPDRRAGLARCFAASVATSLGRLPRLKELGARRHGRRVSRGAGDGQFEQRVALKLIKRGMDSEEIQRRFLAERQILARLRHPNIARLVDGGVTVWGQPWFAMEYVDGAPITDYCDAPTPRRRRAAAAVRGSVPRGPPRAPESGGPSRPQAFQHPRHPRWRSEAARLRHREAVERGAVRARSNSPSRASG